ncbi:hypothetical protein H1P_1020019 [Hyella patelloides LEGE 07179]|uniref:Tail specific protease domain-containing protein n=1 Tax=Hyella patelloides LEGE 07179 TaxID=945734 RepID=A0A563VIW9_9CYAN|nr:S41 family peptidase [Hyella patelloides]VEP11396.1 hypothetical protein H1P_1020019 [Hyella patelloides LEGE 07179]
MNSKMQDAYALSRQGVDNLLVFARLLGYIRYFHPSDRAAEANWEQLAITGIRSVETAKEPVILIQKLKAIFTPIAPTVRIFATKESSTVSQTLQQPANKASLQLVAWEHYGVKGDGEEDYSIYHSKRVYWNGEQNQITDEVISSYQPFKADLGSGVSCLIPLALFAKNGKTLPHIPKTKAANSIDYSINERATRLAAVILAWNVWQHFYPYFDVVAVDWLEELQTALKYAATDKDTAAFNKTLQRLVAKLEDGHGNVYLLNQNTSDRFTLPFTWDWVEDSLVITYVLPDSEMDLHPGDVVLKIDGVPAAEVISDREQLISSATPQWKRDRALGRMLEGGEATSVELEVRSIGGGIKTVVARRHILYAPESGFSLPLFWQWRDEQLIITSVITEAAGTIKPDEIVLSIDGQLGQKAIAQQIESLSQQFPDWFPSQPKQDRIRDALKELNNGTKGSTVLFQVRSPYGESRTVELSRTLRVWDRKEPRPPKIQQLRSGIIYINFERINDLDFQQALPLLESATGIIIDLRGYPKVSTNPIGHLIDEPVTSARWHIPQVKYPDRQKLDFDFSNWSIEPKKPKLKAKVVFLTNGSAISYAETYLGIIEHYQLAEIIGQPTAGTNGNVNELILPGGYLIWWTGMKVLKHDGSRHHGVGILPTVPVERTVKGIADKRDEFLQRAIEIVSV